MREPPEASKSPAQSVFSPVARLFSWLIPGLGIKRWMLLILVGIALLGMLILDIYRTDHVYPVVGTILGYAALRFLPLLVRVLLVAALGIGLITYGIWGLNRALLRPFTRPGEMVIDQLRTFRRRDRGPRIVAIGGGHGLSVLLRGLKEHSRNITAVVAVADDGGSS
ncbi:MAG TPA: 2-phospho-L-lactate transferase CofD family protein, partial [Anaerolineales bacterium]